jgi:hypothetical protein
MGMRAAAFELLDRVDAQVCVFRKSFLGEPCGDPVLTKQIPERCIRNRAHSLVFRNPPPWIGSVADERS